MLAVAARHSPRRGLCGARRGRLGRAVEVRRRSDRDRAGDGTADVRGAGRAQRSRACVRSVPAASASSRRRSSRARRGSGSTPRSRRTSARSSGFHPWTSYVIVPLFALANAGVHINGRLLSDAFTSPITLGILIGYVVGKPVGIVAGSWLVTRLSRGRLRPPVGWAALAGGGVDRRHRLHRVAADRGPRVPRDGSSTRRSSACSARRCAHRC